MARPCYRAISALEISVTIVTDAAISFIYQNGRVARCRLDRKTDLRNQWMDDQTTRTLDLIIVSRGRRMNSRLSSSKAGIAVSRFG
jgi:hypothetical protein